MSWLNSKPTLVVYIWAQIALSRLSNNGSLKCQHCSKTGIKLRRKDIHEHREKIALINSSLKNCKYTHSGCGCGCVINCAFRILFQKWCYFGPGNTEPFNLAEFMYKLDYTLHRARAHHKTVMVQIIAVNHYAVDGVKMQIK